MKKILNAKEALTDEKLRPVSEGWSARVFAKVRVADVLPIERSGIAPDVFRFALQAHFDFVVADDQLTPLFAVEYDGPVHRRTTQKTRDRKKDSLCQKFGLPILRINARHLRRFRHLDLLTWLVDVWFLARSFDEAQEKGEIPFDEGFDPLSYISVGIGEKTTWPYWLALDVQFGFGRLEHEGLIAREVPNVLIGYDQWSNVRALASLEVAPGRFVIAKTAARRQLFEVPLADLVSQIILFEIDGEVRLFLEGKAELASPETMTGKFNSFASNYRIGRAGGSSELIQGLPRKCSTLGLPALGIQT